jgi:hypothetical protein
MEDVGSDEKGFSRGRDSFRGRRGITGAWAKYGVQAIGIRAGTSASDMRDG